MLSYMTINQLLEEFYNLPLEKKREKLELMIEQMKDSDDIFPKLLSKIPTMPETSMFVLYHDIMMFANAITEYKRTKNTAALTKAASYLEKIHLLEEEQKKQDQKDIENIENMFATM